MYIELFGCTGAGKSSLARRLVQASGASGSPAQMSEDFMLARVGLGWLPGRLSRRLAVDLLAFAACLGARRRRRDFFRYAWNCLGQLPADLSLARRLNIARNVFKKAGVREIVRRKTPPGTVVVMDEGTLHSAQYLFVQLSADPDAERLGGFLQRVPLPDVAVYLQEEESTLVRRTLARGHPRIPERTPEATRRFLGRARAVCASIAENPRVRDRLVIVDGASGAARALSPAAEPDLQRTLEWIRSSADAPPARGGAVARHAEAPA